MTTNDNLVAKALTARSVKWRKEMLSKLLENQHKGGPEGWEYDGPAALLARVKEELVELDDALDSGNIADIRREAADVANMVMMVADAAEMLLKETNSEIGPLGVGLRRDLTTSPSVEPLEVVERRTIVQALRTLKGNKRATAKALGVSRSTMHRKLAVYEITKEEIEQKEACHVAVS